jgi:Haem-binding domain
MRKRWLTWLGAALVVAFLAAWGIGEVAYPGTNPPQRYDGTILSAASDKTLRQACFDCHSNETRHPWYHHLPVAGLLMGYHIRSGRERLNFSDWPQLDAEQQQKKMRRIVRSLQRDRMPTKDYRLMHPLARLSAEQVAQIARDAQARYGVQTDATAANARR